MQLGHQMSRERAISTIVMLILILLTTSFLVKEVERPGHPTEYRTVTDFGSCNWSYYDEGFSGKSVVVRNRTSWDEAWNELTGLTTIRQPPAIDNVSWDHEMVLVIAYVAAHSGINVNFTSVRQDGTTVYAYVQWTNKTYGIVLPMAHCPFHAIVVESSPDVVFVEDKGIEYELNWWAVLALIVLTTAVIVLNRRGLRPEPQESI